MDYLTFTNTYTLLVTYTTKHILHGSLFDYTIKILSFNKIGINNTHIKLLNGINFNDKTHYLCQYIDNSVDISQNNLHQITFFPNFIVRLSINSSNMLYVCIYISKQIVYNLTLKPISSGDTNSYNLFNILNSDKNNKITDLIQKFRVDLVQNKTDNITQWMTEIEEKVDKKNNTFTLHLKKDYIEIDDQKLYMYNSEFLYSSTEETILKRIIYNGGCIINNNLSLSKIFEFVKYQSFNDIKKIIQTELYENSIQYYNSKATLFIGSKKTINNWYSEYINIYGKTKCSKVIKILTKTSWSKLSLQNIQQAEIIFLPINLLQTDYKNQPNIYNLNHLIKQNPLVWYINNIYFNRIYLEYNYEIHHSNPFSKTVVNLIRSKYRWLINTDNYPLIYSLNKKSPFMFFTNILTDFENYNVIKSVKFLYKIIVPTINFNIIDNNIYINLSELDKKYFILNRNACLNIANYPYNKYKNFEDLQNLLSTSYGIESLESQFTHILGCPICYDDILPNDNRLFYMCGHYSCLSCYSHRNNTVVDNSNGTLYFNKKCPICNTVESNVNHFILYNEENKIINYNCNKINSFIHTVKSSSHNSKNIIFVSNTKELLDINDIFELEKIPLLKAKDISKLSSDYFNFCIITKSDITKLSLNINIDNLLMLYPNSEYEKNIIDRLHSQKNSLTISRFIYKNTKEDNIYVCE